MEGSMSADSCCLLAISLKALALSRGVYFYLFRDIHPGTVYEFLRIPEKFWMTHSMPKTFPEVMNIMLNVNCITKTFLEFQTLTESVYSIHS